MPGNDESPPDKTGSDTANPGATIADVWRKGRGSQAAPIAVRQTRPEDFAAIRELQRAAYPAIEPWSDEQFAAQIAAFPEGQMVVDQNGRVIGASASLVVLWDDYGVNHTWKGITGDGYFTTHNPAGFTLYGAEVVVDAKRRGNGIGRILYGARRRLCQSLNLRRIIAAGRLPGYHKVKDVMSPELYAMRVVWGDIRDPVLRFQMSQGFHYCGVVHNYLPEDGPSCGNAALIVWLNSKHHPSGSTAKARKEAA